MTLAATGGAVTLPTGAVEASSTSGTPTVSVSVSTAGELSASASGESTVNTVATQPSGVGSGGYVYATGALLMSGTQDTWLDLSTTRTWTLSRSSPGTSSDSISIEFSADSAGETIVSRIFITFSAGLIAA